jgi:hypothetical protein
MIIRRIKSLLPTTIDQEVVFGSSYRGSLKDRSHNPQKGSSKLDGKPSITTRCMTTIYVYSILPTYQRCHCLDGATSITYENRPPNSKCSISLFPLLSLLRRHRGRFRSPSNIHTLALPIYIPFCGSHSEFSEIDVDILVTPGLTFVYFVHEA